MWLFCRSGVFSAVRNTAKEGTVLVRSRFRGDLERLCRTHGVKARIKETPAHDYLFRMVVPREEWTRIAAAEAEGVDYPNFKDAVHDGTARDKAYMQTWWAMALAQDAAR